MYGCGSEGDETNVSRTYRFWMEVGERRMMIVGCEVGAIPDVRDLCEHTRAHVENVFVFRHIPGS